MYCLLALIKSSGLSCVSISSNLKENIRATIDELKDAQQSFKIVKNKIMLNNASSDEEDHEEIQLD